MGRHPSIHRSATTMALVLVSVFGWCTAPRATAARAGRVTVDAAPYLVRTSSVGPSGHPEGGSWAVEQDGQNCIAPITVATTTPTASPISTPTTVPTSTPVTANPSPTSTETSGAATLPPLPLNCLVSASPPEAFNALGVPHQVYFLCGSAASTLPGPAATPYPSSGCFDVSARAVDVTSGGTIAIEALRCGDVASTGQQGANCGTVSNPICAVGSSPIQPSGTCSPCPTSFVLRATDVFCHTNSNAGTCPPRSTPVMTVGGGISDCITPSQSSTPRNANVVSATINPGAPHDYRITFTGYVGTTASGACPLGTQLVPQVNLTASVAGSASFTAPACYFSLSVEKKYIEATRLQIVPFGVCGEFVPTDVTGTFGGTPCFFEVKAIGTIVLQENVACDNGTEPATGTDASPAGFAVGSTYNCADNALKVDNVPMPFIPITLTSYNGMFAPTCIPMSRRPMATVSPTAASTLTDTPSSTSTPSATSTPAPSATPIIGTPTPEPGTSGPAFCGSPGSPTTTIITDQSGIAGAVGQQVQYGASAIPPFAVKGSSATIVGRFYVDGIGVPRVHLMSAFNFPQGAEFCDSGYTNDLGVAACSKIINDTPLNVPVSFVSNCMEYDTAIALTSLGPNVPILTPNRGPASSDLILSAPAPNGICIVRNHSGPLTVSASFAPSINSQPPLDTGPVVLGSFGAGTPVAFPTNLATATTSIPSVVPTASAVAPPTSTATALPTATALRQTTPTPTVTIPVSTPTSISTVIGAHILRFNLNAARVAKVHTRADGRGVKSAKQGQKVWLMMYYVIRDLPEKKVSRITTYDVHDSHGRRVFKAVFKGFFGPTPHDIGPSVRYTTYPIERTARPGIYEFRATLRIGFRSQKRTWRFMVVRVSAGKGRSR